MQKQVIISILFLSLFSFFSTAIAGTPYAGGEISYVEHRFVPNYRYADNSKPDNYVNYAKGTELRLNTGYKMQPYTLLSLALNAHVSFNNESWSLNTTEPAHLEYDVPYTFGVSFLPAIQLVEKLSVFAELGVLQGYVREKKESKTATVYDFSDWTTGYSIGGGLSYELISHVNVSILYRYISYEDFKYKSHLPDGKQWETVTDEPSSSSITLGVSYSF